MPDWDHVVSLAQAELPEVEVSTSYGTPALKVRKKLFARLREDSEHLVKLRLREALHRDPHLGDGRSRGDALLAFHG